MAHTDDMPTNPSSTSNDDALARHQSFVRAVEGAQPLRWDDWAMPIHESRALTDLGRDTALWAVGVLQQALGRDFPERARQSKESHPLFWLGLWPTNDVPWVYANLLQLATQLHMFMVRSQSLRKSMRTNLEPINWLHSLLQLEVAGLGAQAGFDIMFEPDLGNGRKADVLLDQGFSLLVEAVSMRMSVEERRILEVMQHVTWRIYEISRVHNVQIVGSIRSIDSQQALARCLARLETAAKSTASDRKKRRIRTPGGGNLHIRYDPLATERLNVTGPEVPTDNWARLLARLQDKSSQADGGGKHVWVRLEELAGLWHFSPLRTMSLSERVASVWPFLRQALQRYENIAGIILAPSLYWTGDVPEDDVHEAVIDSPSGYAGVRVPIPGHRARETIIVARSDQFHDELEAIINWYRDEATWLDWALGQCGQPPFDALVTEPTT